LFPKTASGKENQQAENKKNDTDDMFDYVTRPNKFIPLISIQIIYLFDLFIYTNQKLLYYFILL